MKTQSFGRFNASIRQEFTTCGRTRPEAHGKSRNTLAITTFRGIVIEVLGEFEFEYQLNMFTLTFAKYRYYAKANIVLFYDSLLVVRVLLLLLLFLSDYYMRINVLYEIAVKQYFPDR
uniref:Uncharacterized protein n=1 Tax=Glossina palpalis gambiensis TaxID=67801 RepID=A0A1B0AUA3_9MUSC